MGRRLVASAALVCAFAAALPASERPDKTALRCWRCGEVFTVLEQASAGVCPACRALCRKTGEAGVFKIHCLDAGESRCSFVCRFPDGGTVVYIGARKNEGGKVAEYLAQLGIGEVTILVGAEPEEECLRSVVELMRRVRVGQLFDPGFRGEDARYAEFVDLVRRKDTEYRVVRGMENIPLGPTRLYLLRAGSFGSGPADGRSLTLCIVHGGNSFLLSRSAHAGGAAARPPPSAEAPAFLFTGSSADLKAVGSPYGPQGAMVIESNGTSIGVRSLGRIAVSSGGEIPAPPRSAAPAGGSRQAGGAAPAAKINLNSASAAELDALSGIGPRKAAAIVDFREKSGRFSRIEDLKKVPGIGEKLFERNKGSICVD